MDLRKVSHIIIFLPLLIVVGFLLFSKPQKAKSTVSVSPTPQSISPVQSKKTKIDLVGPYQCSYGDTKMTAQVFIKNKQIFAQVTDTKVQYYLLNDDCLYIWEKGAKAGQKLCGMKQYLSLYEMLGSYFDVSTLLPLLSQMGNTQISEMPKQMPNLADSCKKGEVNDSVFAIPNGIVFQEAKE